MPFTSKQNMTSFLFSNGKRPGFVPLTRQKSSTRLFCLLFFSLFRLDYKLNLIIFKLETYFFLAEYVTAQQGFYTATTETGATQTM